MSYCSKITVMFKLVTSRCILVLRLVMHTFYYKYYFINLFRQGQGVWRQRERRCLLVRRSILRRYDRALHFFPQELCTCLHFGCNLLLSNYSTKGLNSASSLCMFLCVFPVLCGFPRTLLLNGISEVI